MSIFKGEKWEVVSTRRAKEIACKKGYSEGMWELFLFEANKEMIEELKKGDSYEDENIQGLH